MHSAFLHFLFGPCFQQLLARLTSVTLSHLLPLFPAACHLRRMPWTSRAVSGGTMILLLWMCYHGSAQQMMPSGIFLTPAESPVDIETSTLLERSAAAPTSEGTPSPSFPSESEDYPPLSIEAEGSPFSSPSPTEEEDYPQYPPVSELPAPPEETAFSAPSFSSPPITAENSPPFPSPMLQPSPFSLPPATTEKNPPFSSSAPVISAAAPSLPEAPAFLPPGPAGFERISPSPTPGEFPPSPSPAPAEFEGIPVASPAPGRLGTNPVAPTSGPTISPLIGSPASMESLVPAPQIHQPTPAPTLAPPETGESVTPPLRQAPPAMKPKSKPDSVVYSVDDFGAIGNGIANDTQAFLKTWRMACRRTRKYQPKQTIMLVPNGKEYLVFPMTLRGPCRTNFTLEVAGKIVAPADPRIWKDFDYQLWILIKRVSDFNLIGPGTIDGRGQTWWEQSCKRNAYKPCQRAPTALTFRHSTNIGVQRINFENSQQMHLDFSACTDVTLKYLTVLSPASSPNTDGIHIERSKKVSISKSSISTGDDCISIATGSSKVLIQDITCGPGHGISIGSLGKKGSFDRVSDVRVENVVLRNTQNGLRIKTWEGGRGSAHDFTFQHITMDNVKNPIVIDQFYCDSQHSGTCTPEKSKHTSKGVQISSVLYSDITGTAATHVAVMFRCSHTNPCRKIFLEDVTLQYKGNQASSFCENAYGSAEKHVLPPTCLLSESS